MKVRVAVAQFDPKLGLIHENMAIVRSLVVEAASRGACLVVLPEMATTGYLFQDRAEAAPYAQVVPGPATVELEALARESSIHVVAGLLEVEPESGFLYNTAVLIGPEGYLGKYRKTHPFFADTRWAVDGDLGFPVFDLPFGRVGIMVCMDVSFFEVARTLAVAGAKVIAFPLNSRQPAPTEQWSVRAAENGVYVMAANRTGFERGTRFSGGSAVVAPDGKVLASLGNEPGVAIVELDAGLYGRDYWGYGAPVASRRPETYYSLLLRPCTWSASEVYGLTAGGNPSVVAASYAGTAAQLRTAAETAWHRHMQARKAKPDVILFPEKCLVDESGQPVAIPASEALAWGRQAAGDMDTALCFGFLEKEAGAVFNALAYVGPEQASCVYRQVHIPSAQQGRAVEQGNVAAGDAFRVVDTAWGRVGLALGGDLFFPETLACLSQMGADIVLAGARSGSGMLGMMVRERSRSFNLHVAVAHLDRAPLLVPCSDAGATGSSTGDAGGSAGPGGAGAGGGGAGGSGAGDAPFAANLGLDSGLGTGDVSWARFDCGAASTVRLKPAMKRRRPELYRTLAGRRGQ